MRVFVQIVAIFAFVLAGSQFSHGHESSDRTALHVHGHEISLAGHDDNASANLDRGNIVHCGAHLLLLAWGDPLKFTTSRQTFELFLPQERQAIHLTFDPPPPRA